jgi:serine/threonine protein kinase
MAAPSTVDEFLDLVRKTGVLDEKRLDAYLEKARAAGAVPPDPGKMAGLLIRDGLLTQFQAEQVMLGKWRKFSIGKYKVLERLGSGGMGSVYLCEHKLMRRRVAVKVLPTAKADDPSSLERFYREARAVAALDHPNIVRAYDIDQDEKLHFLVMEYVDGRSLQELIKLAGPMNVLRATHYIQQSAMGLQHAHETAGLVHRDVKPGNILVDRTGAVKVLDMGLARFFNDDEDILTKKYDENVLGTADYLAPEQALDSHAVDIRADIYSLGATFYFCLTGKTPFSEGSVAQKLIWHQTRQPKPIRSMRPEVPEELVAIIDKMMAKDPGQRYQSPQEVVEALAPWTQTPIGPPPAEEMPQLSLAATGPPSGESGPKTPTPSSSPVVPLSGSKGWQVPSSAPGPRSPAPPPSGPRVQPPPSKQPAAAPALNPTPRPPTAPAPRVAPAASPKPASSKPAPAKPAPPKPAAPAKAPVVTVPAAAVRNSQPKPAATAVEPAKEEDDSPIWDQLAPETEELAAHAQTTPKSGANKPASIKKHLSSTNLHADEDRRKMWLVVGIVGAVVTLGIVVICVLAFNRGDGPAKSDNKTDPNIRGPLIVSKSGGLTVAQALSKAASGDRIILRDAVIEETRLTGLGETYRSKNVTIEAESGQVVWRVPDNADPNYPILEFAGAEGWRLQGNIVFDGRGLIDHVITIRGQCPGLALQNLDIKGFKKSGLRIMNCAGSADRHVLLSGLKVSGAPNAEAGIAFEIRQNYIPDVIQFIDVVNCQFTSVKQRTHVADKAMIKNVSGIDQ